MTIIGVTLKGIARDRVFRGLLVAAVALVAVPAISALSMRQAVELALTLCLSLISFLLLLLAVFLGGASLWKDMERRYAHAVLSLPVSRSRYLVGRFAGIALFLLGTAAFLGLLAVAAVQLVAAAYPPDRPVAWATVAIAIGFDLLKCLLLVAFAVFFSALSTSFFLPIFGTIAIYLVGGASQQAYDYVRSPLGEQLAPVVSMAATVFYYLIPNFSAFDLKVNAIYAIPLDGAGLGLTLAYFLVYTAVVIAAAAAIFERRELL